MASGLVRFHLVDIVFGRLSHGSAVSVRTGDIAITVVGEPVEDFLAFMVDRFHLLLVESLFPSSLSLQLLLLVVVSLSLGLLLELVVSLVGLSGSGLVGPETAISGLYLWR